MTSRPSVVGPDAGPEAPYPLHMEGKVISGFGRAWYPYRQPPVDEAMTPWISDMASGVYFGYASLALPSEHPDAPSSASSNAAPQSGTEDALLSAEAPANPPSTSSPCAEVHVLHKFTADFYDVPMRLLILGFIREEKDYKSLEALIEDINFDCEVAKNSLAREAWAPEKGRVISGKDVGGHLDVQWLVRDA
ncbi:Riboflavin kinase [Fusarium culmorum]|uniref:Riboflavin kinase n=1 Tax=Fusarium culmorum TaxID=5516 RepID=A0A2T4GQ13_FUSCU|nr:Riboflavin kinase [Fusarium culmorum]